MQLEQNNNELKLIAVAYKSLVEHLQTTQFMGNVAFSKLQNRETIEQNKKIAYEKQFKSYLGITRSFPLDKNPY